MFILNEDINDLLFFLSLSSALVFLSLMLISYGLQRKIVMIMCVFLLMISSVTAVMHFWTINPGYKDGNGVVSREGFDLNNFFCWPVACPLPDIICAVDLHVQIELQDVGYNIDDLSSREGANKFLIWDHHIHPERIPEGHHEPSTHLRR